jgi:hypothetical protein
LLYEARKSAVVRRPSSKPNFVKVVADNPETIDGLYAYFSGVGVASSGTRELDSAAMVPPAATALVLFPDGFQHADVQSTILALRRARPKLLIVLVTAAPQHLGAVLEPDGRSVPPLVLPRPAFGWTILDAIRGRENLLPP